MTFSARWQAGAPVSCGYFYVLPNSDGTRCDYPDSKANASDVRRKALSWLRKMAQKSLWPQTPDLPWTERFRPQQQQHHHAANRRRPPKWLETPPRRHPAHPQFRWTVDTR